MSVNRDLFVSVPLEYTVLQSAKPPYFDLITRIYALNAVGLVWPYVHVDYLICSVGPRICRMVFPVCLFWSLSSFRSLFPLSLNQSACFDPYSFCSVWFDQCQCFGRLYQADTNFLLWLRRVIYHRKICSNRISFYFNESLKTLSKSLSTFKIEKFVVCFAQNVPSAA